MVQKSQVEENVNRDFTVSKICVWYRRRALNCTHFPSKMKANVAMDVVDRWNTAFHRYFSSVIGTNVVRIFSPALYSLLMYLSISVSTMKYYLKHKSEIYIHTFSFARRLLSSRQHFLFISFNSLSRIALLFRSGWQFWCHARR